MKSTAHLSSEQLTVEPRGWAKLWALTFRPLVVSVGDIESVDIASAHDVGESLGWKLGGTALNRQRAMGWFTIRGQRRAHAWVWLTPDRTMKVFRVHRDRLRLVAVPCDWFQE